MFIRELISNASEALDEIMYRSLTEPLVLDILNALTLIDAGIGMKKVELIKNIGTMVRSRTKASTLMSQKSSRWRSKMAASTIDQIGGEGSQMSSLICRWAPDRGRDQTPDQNGSRAWFTPRSGNKGICVIYYLNINELNLLNLINAFESAGDFWEGWSIAPAGCLCLWSPYF